MIRLGQLLVVGTVSAIAIVFMSPLLFWLGRSVRPVRSELVVDPDLLSDDPGVDIDGDPVYS